MQRIYHDEIESARVGDDLDVPIPSTISTPNACGLFQPVRPPSFLIYGYITTTVALSNTLLSSSTPGALLRSGACLLSFLFDHLQ